MKSVPLLTLFHRCENTGKLGHVARHHHPSFGLLLEATLPSEGREPLGSPGRTEGLPELQFLHLWNEEGRAGLPGVMRIEGGGLGLGLGDSEVAPMPLPPAVTAPCRSPNTHTSWQG